jgi:hypothetical protein
VPQAARSVPTLRAEDASDGAQELQRAIGFGDVVIAPRGPYLVLIALHGE